MKLKLVKPDLYLLCLSILSGIYLLKSIYIFSNNTMLLEILEYLNWFTLFLLLIRVFTLGFTKKELLFILITIILLVFVYFSSGYTSLIQGFLLIVSAKNEKFDSIIKILLYNYLFYFIFAILLYLTHISDTGVERRNAISLGFTNANVCAGIIQTIWFLYLLLSYHLSSKDRNRALVFLILTFISLLVKSRATIAIMAASFLLITFIDKKNYFSKLKGFSYYCVPLFVLLTLISSKLYGNVTLFQKLDIIFNYRISMNYFNLKEMGISFFGKKFVYNRHFFYNAITKTYSNFNTLDNAYICLILEMGIVGTLIWVYIYILFVKECIKNSAYKLLVIMLFIAAYGLTESSIINIYISFPLLFLFAQKHSFKNG